MAIGITLFQTMKISIVDQVIYAQPLNDYNLFFMSIVLAAGCIGFLPFNFPRARVFMGDVGSIFLGFVFASFVVKLSTSWSS